MPSAAEQLASNFNFRAFGKATELRQRLFFTLGALVVARLGTYIPMPGIDPAFFRIHAKSLSVVPAFTTRR